MQEFAEAGFPSDEDDAKDPVSRTKAMNLSLIHISEPTRPY